MRQLADQNTGSDNSLSPGRRQAIIWTNVGIKSLAGAKPLCEPMLEYC